MHDQDARFASNQCDRNEVVERMKLQLRIQSRADRIGLRSEQKRVTIRRDFAASSAPIVAPAPGLFSTTTCWPRRFGSSWAMIRVGPSTAPPGENGTMIRIAVTGSPARAAAPDRRHPDSRRKPGPGGAQVSWIDHRVSILTMQFHHRSARCFRLEIRCVHLCVVLA